MQAPRVVHINGVCHVLAYIKRAPGKAYYTKGIDIFMLRPTLMQDMREIKLTVSLIADMPLMLEEILLLGDHKNNMLFLAAASSWSKGLWLIRYQKCFG